MEEDSQKTQTAEQFLNNAQYLARKIFSTQCENERLSKEISANKKQIKKWQNQLLAMGMFGLENQVDPFKTEAQ